MYGYIYETTNLITNRKYIGRHKADKFEPEKYIGSGTALLKAVEKYGRENFKCELLYEAFDEQDLIEKEEYYISLFDCNTSRAYYNLIPGGKGKSIKGTVRITDGVNCKQITPKEAEEFLQENPNWYYGGPKNSPETVAKRTASYKQNVIRTKEWNNKISASLTGKPLSEKHKASLSRSHKGLISAPTVSVKCVETNTIYNSMHDAARAVNRDAANIHVAITKGTVCAGFHWIKI